MSVSLNTVSAMSLFVEDLAETKRFYRDVFDAPVVYEDAVSAALEFDGVILNLLHSAEAAGLVEPAAVAGPESGSRFQLSIWVNDLDAVVTALAQRGVRLTGPVVRPWGMRTVTFTDPAGHSWEIAQKLDG